MAHLCTTRALDENTASVRAMERLYELLQFKMTGPTANKDTQRQELREKARQYLLRQNTSEQSKKDYTIFISNFRLPRLTMEQIETGAFPPDYIEDLKDAEVAFMMPAKEEGDEEKRFDRKLQGHL